MLHISLHLLQQTYLNNLHFLSPPVSKWKGMVRIWLHKTPGDIYEMLTSARWARITVKLL